MSSAGLALVPDVSIVETVRALTLSGKGLLERMAFQGEPTGYLDEEIAYLEEKNNDNKRRFLFILDANIPEQLEEGEATEGNFESRWNLGEEEDVKLAITCPQLHMHGQPHLMPEPFCSVCNGSGRLQVEVGKIVTGTRLCHAEDCDADHGECKEHCLKNDYGDHSVPTENWEVDNNAVRMGSARDKLILKGDCDCGMTAKMEIDVPGSDELEWEE